MTPLGKLIAIGGNEDKYTEQESNFIQKNNPNFFELGILRRIVAECEVNEPRIEVITTASRIPEEIGKTYLNAFLGIGCRHVGIMHIGSREEAVEKKYADRMQKADAVMFTGGDQFRLSSILGGTPLMEVVSQKYFSGPFVVAGTSAGAMAMSRTMIRMGSSSEALLKGQVKLASGLGFIDDVIIDSHFVKRGRFGRLAQAIAGNPVSIGIGLGEDTGVLITKGNNLETIGSGLVIIFDGHQIRHNNISELPDGAPISIEHMIVHVLSLGNTYSLDSRRFGVGSAPVFTDTENE
ncbi:MAG: cyanophycinase [Flavobacteriales bacterium]|nr:cyanophycinase [Flavobacteriales bacterium]